MTAFPSAGFFSLREEWVGPEWQQDDDSFHLDVTVAPNTSASLHIPCGQSASVSESGKPLDESDGTRQWRREGGGIIGHIGSGSYRFHAPL